LRPVCAVLILASTLAFSGHGGHLHSPADRTAFRRWFTFLVESRYYARKPMRAIADGDGLMRWAYHEALHRHDAHWAHRIELPLFPAMPSVEEPGMASDPFAPQIVSRSVDDAMPGDLLLYRRTDRPAHLMIYIGRSQVVPSPHKWVVYVNAPSDPIQKVSLDSLRTNASAGWRPTPDNPDFLGVGRLEILQD
jgi:hypothetical protein